MNRIDLDMLCAIADVYMTRQEERLLQTMEPSAAHAFCERIAPEFLLFVRALFRIAPVYDELGRDETCARQRLTESDFSVWSMFAQPFDKSMFSASEIDRAERLWDVWPCDRAEWENRLCSVYERELTEQASQRVGSGTSGVFLIEAAQALCKRLTMPSAEYEIGRAVNELSARWIDHYTTIFDETGRKMQ